MSRSSEIIHFIVIWDHISNAEQAVSDDLYHTSEYVLQDAPQNLIITKRHLLEYVPRYVLEYVPISYDKYRGAYRGMYSGTHRLVMVLSHFYLFVDYSTDFYILSDAW